MSQMPPPPPTPPPPPPPPPGGYSGGTTPAGAQFNVGDAVSYGWSAYWKNVGPMLAITAVIIVVQVIFGLIRVSVNNVGASILLGIIGFVVSMVLALGLIRASLAVTRGETPEIAMLTDSNGWGPYIGAAILFGLMVGIGTLACVVPGIILAVIFHFYGYVIAENPQTSVTDSLKRSAEITRGHRWPLFGLGVLLILINIVGFIACFVGAIFTYGISAIAVAYAYRTLTGQSVAPVA